ncbi:MAG TPA: sugar ABC transporter ATP-binding protein [Blastocatellia bacterium]
MAHLRLSDITKRFGPTIALDGVSMEVREGEVHALIGENGAGKSTLMNVITGTTIPDAGRMDIDGRAYAPGSPIDATRNGIALIHQELSLFPHLTVAENILIGREQTRFGWVDRRHNAKLALNILHSFGRSDISPDATVSALPIAARQVVEICRAIAARARIILMDEPTSSLQRQDAERLFELIARMRDEGLSVVFISHFLEEVRQVADRYTVLRDGRTAGSGTLADSSDAAIITMMVGRAITDFFPSRMSNAGETLLEVNNLTSPPTLVDATFELRRGEILGIAGLMGSGRTEMVRALFGLDPAARGAIKIGSHVTDIQDQSAAGSIKAGIGYVSEDRQHEGLALRMSVADNITMTRLGAFSKWGWLSAPAQRAHSAELARQLSIKTRDQGQAVRTLSGGNQQKVAIARLLHDEIRVLLLDEPTRGIDVGSKSQIYELIAQMADSGKAVLMVSSYLPELFGMCDRLAVMSKGRLGRARPIADWTAESVLQAAIGGEQPNA